MVQPGPSTIASEERMPCTVCVYSLGAGLVAVVINNELVLHGAGAGVGTGARLNSRKPRPPEEVQRQAGLPTIQSESANNDVLEPPKPSKHHLKVTSALLSSGVSQLSAWNLYNQWTQRLC